MNIKMYIHDGKTIQEKMAKNLFFCCCVPGNYHMNGKILKKKEGRKMSEDVKTLVKKENWKWFKRQLKEHSNIKWAGGEELDDLDPFYPLNKIVLECNQEGLRAWLGELQDSDKISNFNFFRKCEEMFPISDGFTLKDFVIAKTNSKEIKEKLKEFYQTAKIEIDTDKFSNEVKNLQTILNKFNEISIKLLEMKSLGIDISDVIWNFLYSKQKEFLFFCDAAEETAKSGEEVKHGFEWLEDKS